MFGMGDALRNVQNALFLCGVDCVPDPAEDTVKQIILWRFEYVADCCAWLAKA